MPDRTAHRRRGFNLLEVVIAAFIFSVSAVAFLGIWGLQARSVEKSRHRLVATLLAEQLAEDSLEAGYERTRLTEDGEEPENNDIPITTETKDPRGNWGSTDVLYHWEKRVTNIGGEDDRLKKVEIRVTWEDSTKNGEVKLVTYLAGVF